MAYIPPHKRHSKGADELASSLASNLSQTLTLGPNNRGKNRRNPSHQDRKIIYAAGAISRWWPAGAAVGGDDGPIPSSFRLEPVSCEPIERKARVKSLVLAGDRNSPPEGIDESPWVTIAERIQPDLLNSVQEARKELGSDAGEFKLSFASRVGKIYFDGNVSFDSIRKAAISEEDSRNQVYKTFYTNVSNSYMEDIQHIAVSKIGLVFESEKEHYHVKVFDKSRPHTIISCKCTIAKDGRGLQLYKMELKHLRNLVVDVSCLYKDLDLRLMLVTKRTLKTPTDEEKDGINALISSAIFDPSAKGGLRWHIGKDSAAERFSIFGVWHSNYKAFRGPTARLKLRHADRYDHKTSTGEVTNEATLKLTGISRKLNDGDLEPGPLTEMVRDAVKLVWNHFLSFSRPSI